MTSNFPAAPTPLDIAIVGMGCLLPGAASVRAYWGNILGRRDCIVEVPPDRFEIDRWFDADRRTRDKCYSRWGGFVDDVVFDPIKYGIPPTAVPSIEPMQLLTLEVVSQALRDAGYLERNPYRETTGVVLGVGGGMAELGAMYAMRAMLPQVLDGIDESLWRQLPEWTEDSFAGILLNVVAGRVASRFDLGGPNYIVDAACASSLAAVYLACRELSDGAADMVITGGCDTVQNPLSYLCFAKAGALSPTGRSKPFDAGADGIAISEGLAVVVLKRRADAERDGDRIYALIRGVAGGSDGRSKGITAPHVAGQLRTLRRAYQQAGIDPSTVGLFEAHGTGTVVGDETECEALKQLIGPGGSARPGCIGIGSVKSNMGHTKCAAGVAGLMKAALALYHRILPPTIHVKTPNPRIFNATCPLYPVMEVKAWNDGGHPRRAGVSSFGFGGSNFHAVLEEHGTGAPRPTINDGVADPPPVQEAPPRHAWLVNGGYARPAGTPKRVATPRARMGSPVDEHRTAARPAATPVSRTMQGREVADGNGQLPNGRLPIHQAGAFADFQETMRQFLESQAAVLAAFRQADATNGHIAGSAPSPVATFSKTIAPEEPARPVAGRPAEPPVKPAEVQAVPVRAATQGDGVAARHNLVRRIEPAADVAADPGRNLLEIVSERTGYPVEMLDVNANIEADLGIDSIKRVEIIGAFRRSVLPGLTEAPSWFMERMTSAKTMQQILDGVTELAQREGKGAGHGVASGRS